MEKNRDNDKLSASVKITWHPTSTYANSQFQGAEITCIEDVTAAISSAQQFIIETSKREVAPDVIEINLKAPGLTDVTLIDLPGIVRTTGIGESEELGDMINELIQGYVDNERCIVVPVIPANVDFHNNEVIRTMRKVDPTTKRTKPVITKPDLIDLGGEDEVMELLLGRRVQSYLGFHIVKCRAQLDLKGKMTIPIALEKEETFFKETPPWKDFKNQKQIGITNLREDLSSIQINLLKESIPLILKDIRAVKDNAMKKLAQFGEGFESEQEIRSAYNRCLQKYLRALEDHLLRDAGDFRTTDGFTFRAKLVSHYEEFGSSLRKMKLYEYGEIKEGEIAYTYVDGQRVSVRVKAIEQNTVQVGILNTSKSQSISITDVFASTDSDLVTAVSKFRTSELAVFPSSVMFNKIVRNSIESDWIPLKDKLMESTLSLLNDLLRWILENVETMSAYPSLVSFLRSRFDSLIEETYEAAVFEAMRLMNTEKIPLTFNDYLFQTVNKMNQAVIRSIVSKGTVAHVLNYLNEVNAMSNDEHLASQMQIILSAYGKVAAKRTGDEIPLSIENYFILSFPEIIRTSLSSVSDAELGILFKESASMVQERKRCKDIVDKMSKSAKAIQEMMISI